MPVAGLGRWEPDLGPHSLEQVSLDPLLLGHRPGLRPAPTRTLAAFTYLSLGLSLVPLMMSGVRASSIRMLSTSSITQ